jgi:hypothetical protein
VALAVPRSHAARCAAKFFIVDMAEIPVFKELGRMDTDADGTVSAAKRGAYLVAAADKLRRGLDLTIAGQALECEVLARDLSTPPGQAGLQTLRLQLVLDCCRRPLQPATGRPAFGTPITVSAWGGADVRHIVYVNVAHPAPLMKAFIEVRKEGEALVKSTGIPATIVRPWYVLGPGHRWPYLLVPVYAVLGWMPLT